MYFEEFSMDLEWKTGSVEITADAVREFHEKYDAADIHTGRYDDDGNEILKSPQTLYTMKLWNEWLKFRVPGDEFIAGTVSEVKFHRPLYSGEKIWGEVHVHEIEDRAPKPNGRVCVRVDGYNQDGEPVVTSYNHLIMKKKSICEKKL